MRDNKSVGDRVNSRLQRERWADEIKQSGITFPPRRTSATPSTPTKETTMKTWFKPEITETEAGMEVTSYLPAELDRA